MRRRDFISLLGNAWAFHYITLRSGADDQPFRQMRTLLLPAQGCC
jgi:hypothetical protein